MYVCLPADTELNLDSKQGLKHQLPKHSKDWARYMYVSETAGSTYQWDQAVHNNCSEDYKV